jgi:hypothetical protein
MVKDRNLVKKNRSFVPEKIKVLLKGKESIEVLP